MIKSPETGKLSTIRSAMSNYDLVIAKARAFNGETYHGLLREIADFAEGEAGLVILGVNIQDNNPEDNEYPLTAYVMYEN
jgi:hypothetical protein